MTRLRTHAEIMALPDLSPAERRLMQDCPAGKPTALAFVAPEEATDANRVRAEILRYLILGGCKDCRPDERGVHLLEAYVTGPLDLSFATAKGATVLKWCHFDARIEAKATRFTELDLSGSRMPGLNAQGARVTGNVFLRGGFHATGGVVLSGAEIGGQLECVGGRFENVEGLALNAEGARVTGSVFLCEAFCAKGEVRLMGAEIGGQLACVRGRFENGRGRHALNAERARVTGNVFLNDGFHATGEVGLSGAEIGGQLTCKGGRFENGDDVALNGQNMRVAQGFLWQEVGPSAGRVDLSSAWVGDLVDDPESWPGQGSDGVESLYLDGFVYERISASFTDAKRRLDWLARGDRRNGEFCPQPYEQLAKVLGEMGHAEDRRLVLMARERLQRRADRAAVPGHAAFGAPKKVLIRVGDWFLEWVVGYGYKPWRSIYAAAGLIGVGWVVAHLAWVEGSFAPNSDVIVDSAAWQVLARDASIANPAEVWAAGRTSDTGQGQGMDYESFHALAYAVDLVVPLVVLGQEAAWAPSKDRGTAGWHLWWLRWVLTGAGWIVTGFGAAAVTGLIRRD